MPMELDTISTKELIAISNEFILDARYPQLNKDELRLVLCMLSLLKKTDEDFKKYRIAVKDLMAIYKISHKNYIKRLDDATDGLMKKIIKFNTAGFEFDKLSWCSSAKLVANKYVELTFHPDLKSFLLLLKGNFTAFDFSEALFLTGFYTQKIFQLVKCFQGIGVVSGNNERVVELEWLRNYLDIRPEMYKTFGPFKLKVLEPAKRDIKENTSLVWDFTPIKTGRKITALNFRWAENKRHKQGRLPLPVPEIAEYDDVGQRLKELGFHDWANMREYLPTEKDWELAFDNLEYEKKTREARNEIVDNPGGWLRSQLKKVPKGDHFSPTPQFKNFLDKEREKKELDQKNTELIKQQLEEAENKRKEVKVRKDLVELKIKEMGSIEWEALKAKGRDLARKRIKEPKVSIKEKQEAAKNQFNKLSAAQKKKIEKETFNATMKAFEEIDKNISEKSPLFINAYENAKLKLIEKQYDLKFKCFDDYNKKIEKAAEIEAKKIIEKTV